MPCSGTRLGYPALRRGLASEKRVKVAGSMSIMNNPTNQGHAMVRIEVSADVARRIMESGESIEIVDDRGRRLGFVGRPISDDEIAEARRRAESEESDSALDEVWARIKEKHGGK